MIANSGAPEINNTLSTGFAPAGSSQPSVLILGSLPGIASLNQQQYFAHPRNQFWPIAAEIMGFEADSSYAERLSILTERRIMLWDVVYSAYRKGSLDSSIKTEGLQVNEFFDLLNPRSVRLVVFNGAAAEKYFNQYAVPELLKKGLEEAMFPKMIKMPSTSPANASFSFEQKLSKWRYIENYI